MEKEYVVKILFIEFVTHNVKRFILEKPVNYSFINGQAVDISINKEGFRDKKRPFSFTSQNSDLVLEFIIKIYKDHNGVTKELDSLKLGDELIIAEPFGDFAYKGNGVFIAGGTGITPFIGMFRILKDKNKIENNKLIFSNKEYRDIILERELKDIFNDNLILVLTQEKKKPYEYGKINEEFLKKHIKNFKDKFYICGPQGFVNGINEILAKLGSKTENISFSF